MQMNPVKSSNIAQAGYDVNSRTMRVQFSNGTQYDFKDVSADTFGQFQTAKSQGKFFNANIKGQFTGSKVKTEEDK
jgi:hypothetical protein